VLPALVQPIIVGDADITLVAVNVQTPLITVGALRVLAKKSVIVLLK